MNTFEKRQIIAEYNYKNKTYFRYDMKTDSVIEEFNSKSVPITFDEWYRMYKQIVWKTIRTM